MFADVILLLSAVHSNHSDDPSFVTTQGSATISASIRPFVLAQNEAVSTGLAATRAYTPALVTQTTFAAAGVAAAYAVWLNVGAVVLSTTAVVLSKTGVVCPRVFASPTVQPHPLTVGD